MPSEQHTRDHTGDTEPDDSGERPDIFPTQFRSVEDAADVAELAAAERAVARHAGTPEDVEGVAEAGKARRGEDRLEGWRRRHHTDRDSRA
jgi:hypothetical protein